MGFTDRDKASAPHPFRPFKGPFTGDDVSYPRDEHDTPSPSQVPKAGRKKRGPLLDLIPEHTHYQDDGCEVSPSCLGCPLPRCKYDEPDGGRLLVKALRNQEIHRLHREEGLVVAELARRFRLSKRSVHRILASERTGEQGTRI